MHYALLLGLLLLLGATTASNYERTLAENQSTHVEFVAGQLRAYGGYVAAYAHANPSTTGGVSDAAAGVPAWLQRPPSMAGYVRSGQAFIYMPMPSEAEAFRIARACGGGLKCGVTRSRDLYLPGAGTPIISGLPTSIPANRAVVLVL